MATDSSSEGRILKGKYRLLRRLSQGGMGQVFEAVHKDTDGHFAIKLLHPQFAQHKEAVERFKLEARALAKFKHPNIVGGYDLDMTDDGEWFIVQEYLDGQDLSGHLATRGRLAPREALKLLCPIADALSAVHRRNIIHRDIKPSNIVLAEDEGGVVPKLVDFGIARQDHDAVTALTQLGARLGTKAFMSPEQFEGAPRIDSASDVWSFGLVIYVTLGGVNPFDAVRDGEDHRRVLVEGIRPLDPQAGIPPELSSLLDEMLVADAGHRARDMHTISRRLRMILDQIEPGGPLTHPTQDPPTLPPAAATPPVGLASTAVSRRALAAAAVALLVALLIFAWDRALAPQPAPPERVEEAAVKRGDATLRDAAPFEEPPVIAADVTVRAPTPDARRPPPNQPNAAPDRPRDRVEPCTDLTRGLPTGDLGEGQCVSRYRWALTQLGNMGAPRADARNSVIQCMQEESRNHNAKCQRYCSELLRRMNQCAD